MATSAPATDRNTVFLLAGIIVLAVLLVSVFGPAQGDDDPMPTTYNTGSRGIEGAYLLLSELGYNSQRWTNPTTQLDQADAPNTTLILAQPIPPIRDLKATQAAIAGFLKRGGRVIATGASGALLLPGGSTAAPGQFYQRLCYTMPEGSGILAQAGHVALADPARWSATGPEYRVEQRCGSDAVVVRYPYGRGEAIWWSSPMPLTNAGIKQDASLRLTLASIGPARRTVLFDEYLHEQRESVLGTLKGLPWWSLALQALALGLFLVLSRGRRNGPLRLPLRLPRTSPIEFAESMGRLYARAGATQAATEAARNRLLAFLAEHCGLPRPVLDHPPAIAGALADRLGGDWSSVAAHLEQAQRAATSPTKPASALRLVQALEADQRRLQARLASTLPSHGQHRTSAATSSDKLQSDPSREEVAQ
jgi:hypothetical protein